ncbi:MAG: T9SS type A sorting domain-containing protein [Bacteroidetes bacterium]|nr:T9SS type A sorting domain-containing protein [Bacteroidota bacterium]
MNIFPLISALLITASAFSQQWVEMMQNPNSNFYDIQKEFDAYWSQPEKKKLLNEMKNEGSEKRKWFRKEEEKEVAGWIQFKRWEWLKEQRVYPSGNLFPPDDYFQAVESKLNSTTVAGSWTFLGPSNVPTNGGAGRVNCIRFDPSNTNIVYAGAPAGGLWKSTNGGSGWAMWNTDALGSLGVTDVAVDPTNSQIIYLGSGDGDASDTYGLGVLKSTDGGATWNATGLNWTVTQGRTVRRILIDPTNTQIIHAATSNGIYRSTDGGTTFSQVSTAAPRDMEMKPGDPTTIYATTSATVYRSTNSGQSYVSIYSVSGAGRLAIAVTPADANYIYVLAANNSSSAFLGLYQSINGGTSFSQKSTTPNILGYSNTGNDASGQGWYDLSVAASPANANEVVIGGINIWRSTDGGNSWVINAHWTGSGAPYVHADVHDVIYLPGNGSTIYAGCDGGVFRTQNSGGSWSDMSNGLQIAEQYRLGQSANNGTWLITGRQDNGTDRLNGVTWSRVLGGDGMECFVDRTNNNTMYGEYYNGDFQRSINGGNNWASIQTGLAGSAAWVTPWCQDPTAAATIWAGYQEVFKSTNQGTAWTQMSSLGSTSTIRGIDVAPSSNQVIYASRTTSIIKSTNGGTSWTTVTGNLPVSSASITYIEIDPTDANHVWATFSGYSSANKVWVTTNGGTSWTNYSTGIPNLPVNCIVYETGSANGTLYAGTDLGVYYRDNTMSSWASYSTGLPNVIVDELEIQYTVSKLRAATYGRGMWESPLYSPVGISEPINCENDCINVFPNPTDGKCTLVFASGAKQSYIEIYNVMGEKIYSSQINSGKTEINLSKQPKGIYFLQIQSSGKTYNSKIVID